MLASIPNQRRRGSKSSRTSISKRKQSQVHKEKIVAVTLVIVFQVVEICSQVESQSVTIVARFVRGSNSPLASAEDRNMALPAQASAVVDQAWRKTGQSSQPVGSSRLDFVVELRA